MWKEALIAQRDAEREEQRQKRIANGEAMDEDFLTGQELEDARDKQFFDETMEDEEREKLQRQEFKKTREQRVEESEARYYKRKAKKVQANTTFALLTRVKARIGFGILGNTSFNAKGAAQHCAWRNGAVQ